MDVSMQQYRFNGNNNDAECNDHGCSYRDEKVHVEMPLVQFETNHVHLDGIIQAYFIVENALLAMKNTLTFLSNS